MSSLVAHDVAVARLGAHVSELSSAHGVLQLSGVPVELLQRFLGRLSPEDAGNARRVLVDALGERHASQLYRALVPLVLSDGSVPVERIMLVGSGPVAEFVGTLLGSAQLDVVRHDATAAEPIPHPSAQRAVIVLEDSTPAWATRFAEACEARGVLLLAISLGRDSVTVAPASHGGLRSCPACAAAPSRPETPASPEGWPKGWDLECALRLAHAILGALLGEGRPTTIQPTAASQSEARSACAACHALRQRAAVPRRAPWLWRWEHEELQRLEDTLFKSDAPDDTSIVDILRVLTKRGAGSIEHAIDSFKSHLVGVWKILHRWDQPWAPSVAGLLHSCYSTDAFHGELFSFRERRAVADLVGEGAEGLAYLFCTLDRPRLSRALAASGLDEAGIEAVNFRTGQRYQLGPRTTAALAVIELANLAEQNRAPNGSPRPGLARAAVAAAHTRGFLEVIPPVFDHLRAPLDAARERAAVRSYEEADTGTTHTQQRALQTAAERNPAVGEPWLRLAEVHARGQRFDSARACAQIGLARLRSFGTAWDKRKLYEEWEQIGRRFA